MAAFGSAHHDHILRFHPNALIGTYLLIRLRVSVRGWYAVRADDAKYIILALALAASARLPTYYAMDMELLAPYGTWESPIGTDLITQKV
jgi:hypothetical protein